MAKRSGSRRKRSTRPRSQPRIIGLRRQPMGTSVDQELERAIQKEMVRWNASRSFVIATATAKTLGVDEYPDYQDED